MSECAKNGHPRIAFAGVSDLAEVGTLCAHDHPITLVGIVDAERAGTVFYGLPVRASLQELGAVDVVIVTSLARPDLVFRAMVDELGQGRVFAPQLLPVGVKPATQTLKRAAG
jgi:hypothetical protein